MQKSLSLESDIVTPRATREWEGWLVPWEVQSFEEDYQISESKNALFDLSMYACIGLAGDDARDYLQRMSTVNFKTWRADQTEPGAFLTGKGQIVALGDFIETDGRFVFVTTPAQRETALEHIEKFHFAEKFQTEDLSREYCVFALSCNQSEIAECQTLGVSTTIEIGLKGHKVVVWKDRRRPILWGLIKRSEAVVFYRAWKKESPIVGQRLFDYYRLRVGLPNVGHEISDKEIILEGSLDDHVARNKGCYPGQEVVERIYTYGQVNKKLWPVEITAQKLGFPPTPFAITSGEKAVGNVVALDHVPGNMSSAAGLAYVNKAHWADTEPFVGDGVLVRIVRNSHGG
jgi:folate-binding protein YgfZ